MCLPLILSIKNSGNIKWYIDAKFAVHKNMRSHIDGFVTMGTRGQYELQQTESEHQEFS